MKLNKIMKILVALMLISLVAIMVAQPALATAGGQQDKYIPNADPTDLTQFDSHKDESGASSSVSRIIGSIISIVQVVGVGVAIIMLIVLAIQYISASPEGKAEIKKNATIYIVGSIILFAASGILQIIKNFATTNIKAK